MSSSNLAVGRKQFAITPSNTVNFTDRARCIYCGGDGNVVVVDADGVVVTWPVLKGAYILVESVRVNATGTSATPLIGLV